ncbi:MAG: Fusaric acid resistance protein family, partial [Mycobacterium sp.]|nr:Fusaric acid resistance protein family [Mycobacterium sp.]
MVDNLEWTAKIAQVGGPAPNLVPTEIQQGRDVRRTVSAEIKQRKVARPSTGVGPAKPLLGPPWIPWIFAAKTTASALLALWIAFAFNLDQPKWTLLTVFIVA